jgi:hypothetical protein
VITVSRQPGYETTSNVGYDQENRRKTFAQRADGGIGRPRGAGRHPGRASDGSEVSETELLRLRLRMLELAG